MTRRRLVWVACSVAAVCIAFAVLVLCRPAYTETYGYSEPRVVSYVKGRREARDVAAASSLTIRARTPEELERRIAFHQEWIVVDRHEERWSLYPYCATLAYTDH